MSFLDFLFWLLVEPLKLLFEVVFFFAYSASHNAGLSIIAMSLVINFMLLPLYFRADKLEKEQADKKLCMAPWVTLIKKTFKGDERVMILQAYYRENNYRPTDVFKESVSLFLQIPFFIAAYSFLSGLKMLNGTTLGPITDLSAPDALITAGQTSINALPILMTVINIVSGLIYSQKGMIKDKIKLILIALVFLVLLYGSPSGLVFYWTLNNLFSLGKNIVVHARHAGSAAESNASGINRITKTDWCLLLLSLATIAVFTGLMIPADVVSQNPYEIVNTFGKNPHSPVIYLVTSLLTAIGVFLVWIPLFFYLTRGKASEVLICCAPVIALNGIVNFVMFNKNFGLLTKKLAYEDIMTFTAREIIINLICNAALAAVILLFTVKFKRIVLTVMAAAFIAVAGFSATTTGLIASLVSDMSFYDQFKPEDISVPLTTTGQNVVVIMMDRMIGSYIPYIFNERPDVAEQFDGFNYYPNTTSLGISTITSAPSLYGGYEYTPYNLNSRSDDLFIDKHNESLLVLPVLFANNGWRVSVGDPPYANYRWIPDLSIYDDYDGINAFLMTGTFNERSPLLIDSGESQEIRLTRNFFCYGLMKISPYFLQPVLYCEGNYNYVDFCYNYVDTFYDGESQHVQIGINETYLSERCALESLADVIDISEDSQNCFFIISNGSTHDVSHLVEPDYTPAAYVDNTSYDEAHMDRFTVDGVTMHMEDTQCYSRYETSMAACIALGNWFDYLRENDLYDNTRIIIVSDHGYGFEQFDDLIIEDPDFDAEWINSLLMVKDFGSTGFTVTDDFMTIADTPFLALNGVIDNPVNPFTGNLIEENDKTEDQLIYFSMRWNPNFYEGTQFEDPDGYWLSVRNNIRDNGNWNYYSYEE